MSDTRLETAPRPDATIPSNIYKPTAPLQATLLENRRLTEADSPNDVRHLVFDIADSELRYLDGQSIGVLPPGTDANGKPHKLRLYSIASSADGDDGQGKTLTLCVKRAITEDPVTKQVYYGVCSTYLCDLQPGDLTPLTGPVGKAFLLPETPNANLVMIATGTGVAPFRAFIRDRYGKRPQESGETWLFLGVQTKKDYLYGEELEAYRENAGYHFVPAFSREEKTSAGERMYVQHRLYEHGAHLLHLLQQPNTYLYICGLKGMETGILEALTKAASEAGLDWAALHETLKAEKRWRVEVY